MKNLLTPFSVEEMESIWEDSGEEAPKEPGKPEPSFRKSKTDTMISVIEALVLAIFFVLSGMLMLHGFAWLYYQAIH